MRTDFTVRTTDGRVVDLAVVAPAGTRLADVAGELTGHAGAEPVWSGRRRVQPSCLLGRTPLVNGAVLAAGRDDTAATDAGSRIDVVGGAGAGLCVPLGSTACAVGRASSCELVLPDPRVSRRHAEICARGGRLTVRDLGSTTGTAIDGIRITAEAPVPTGAVIEIGDSFLAITPRDDPVAATRPGPDGAVLVDRPPRTAEIAPSPVFTMPAAAGGGEDFATRLAWGAALVPALAGAVLAWAMHSPQLLVFVALTPLGLLVGSCGERAHRRRARRRAAEAHRGDLARIGAAIGSAVRTEVALRRARCPDPAQLARIATVPTARLWERRRGDTDLLHVRLGLGRPPSDVMVERNGQTAPAALLAPVPSVVDLRAGPLGVVAQRALRADVARWLVAQLAALASPADVELALLVGPHTGWAWARWLPHLRTRVADTPKTRAELVAELAELGENRARSGRGATGWTGSWLVLVVDLDGPLDDIRGLAALLARSADVGIAAICLSERAADLPDACATIARASGEGCGRLELGSLTLVADRVSGAWAERVARALAPCRDGQAADDTLPQQCRLAGLLGVDAPDADRLRAEWRRSDGAPSTVLGIGRDGPVSVDLARDGPHLLIAGTTGAGKSELLRTLVAGLAALHPPSEVSFLLVDYKGGAAFAECASLPHTLGVVTDLDEHLTRRVLASLDSEVRQRERRFAEAGAGDLTAYRAGGRALARLVVVIDEFATLADELPGFVPALVGVAQRGRSLGLHLVLATQRPGGAVSPEIRANTALRIALRTTSAGESADVVEVADAAMIDHRIPGRAYLRIGTATSAVQTAWVGAAAPRCADRIRVAPHGAWRRLPPQPAKGGAATDLALLVAACRSAHAGGAPLRQPWLPPLPDRLTAPDPPPGSAPGLVPVGRLDLPAEQRQPVLGVDLAAGGAILVAGGPRSGRTTTLLTLAQAAARASGADEVHVHAVDAAGAGLRTLASLPHTGTVATIDDDFELTARLIRRLATELVRRRDAPRSSRAPRALLLLVDGWENLLAASEQFDGARTVERLLALLRDAPAAGATVVITGGRAALAPRLAGLLPTRLLLALPDAGDYAQAGVAPPAIPTSRAPGRGVRADDGAEFQIALPPDPVRRGPPAARAIRMRGLPRRVTLGELPARPGKYILAVGGDAAAPIAVDLGAGAGRVLVVGPPRSGRTSVLRTVLAQAGGSTVVVAAPTRSPLAAHARVRGAVLVGPHDSADELPDRGLLLVDDAEVFLDTEAGAALTAWLRADRADRVAVVAGRSDDTAVAFRGVAGEVRRAGFGLLLQPGPHDGELFGVTLPRTPRARLPGRGVLVPDPHWGLAGLSCQDDPNSAAPLAVQAVLPDDGGGGAGQPMCG